MKIRNWDPKSIWQGSNFVSLKNHSTLLDLAGEDKAGLEEGHTHRAAVEGEGHPLQPEETLEDEEQGDHEGAHEAEQQLPVVQLPALLRHLACPVLVEKI